MHWTDVLSQGLTSFVGTINPQIIIFLFLLCLLGEGIGIVIPYVLEATWLMVGYQLGHGELKFAGFPPGVATNVSAFLVLMLVAQAGRQGGAFFMYFLGVSGSKLFRKYRNQINFRTTLSTAPLRFFRKVKLNSPVSIAMGRLLWLRIPLTLILAAQRKLKMLVISVTISSLVYDGAYVVIGAVVGTTTTLEPVSVLIYSVGGLTLIYLIFFGIRHLVTRRQKCAVEENPVQDDCEVKPK